MSTQTKKLIFQTILLIIVIIIIWSINLIFINNIFLADIDFEFIFVYLNLTLFIFAPIIALYFMRGKSSLILGKLFRATAYFSTLVLLFLFFVNFILTINFIHWSLIAYEGLEQLESLFWDLLMSIIYFILAILMYVAARINKSLAEKFSFIPKKKNFKLYLAVISILIVIVVSFYLWFKATSWVYRIESDDFWYSTPELSRMEVRDTYDLAFKKILLVSGLVFASAFLLIKTLPDKN